LVVGGGTYLGPYKHNIGVGEGLLIGLNEYEAADATPKCWDSAKEKSEEQKKKDRK
jgi:hypothetical protein